ncbi:MAG: proline dehydrogenase family protein [Desulfovibrio sp.]|uniref:proline dehydrogenase family protein n=1 Tax=Desulfovibrio sp. 7SRBS1 TaxID=3378064 RepID=UPI003B40EEC5
MWQKTMIALARSARLTEWAEKAACMRFFARRFVGGGDLESGLESVRNLHCKGIRSSLFFLGEYVDDAQIVAQGLREIENAIRGLGALGLDVHVSVDPTQVGAMQNWDVCQKNVVDLAGVTASQEGNGVNVVMIDMEDSSVTTRTLDMFYSLHDRGLPVAVTAQSSLHRSPQDLARLVQCGAMVRLVKGAFAESKDIAVTGRAARDASYRQGIDQLFSKQAHSNGVRPVLGTHDHAMVGYAVEQAEANGWTMDEWEVEMLYGVRPDYQRQLVRKGVSLRLYVPFGRSWWPYSIRRIGENPWNAVFAVRSVVGNIFSGKN